MPRKEGPIGKSMKQKKNAKACRTKERARRQVEYERLLKAEQEASQ